MDELKKQLNILIDKAEHTKLTQMLHGLTSDMRETEGEIQAFKLVRLLINTNLKLVE